ncbi:MAG: virulence RhuM family protein [Lentisphaeria bacterium]|nr:virulence RhuM family protein [Lentisphaeria bacterium]
MKDEIPQDGIIIYNTEDGESKISLFARDGSVWLNQNQMAELFATSKQNISHHIISVLEDKELRENSVVKYYLTTAPDGKNYQVAFYSLEMILAVGFRVRSPRGTQFRQWAIQNLAEFMRKGFVLDTDRLKNPDGRPDYFDELLAQIRDIRASEKRFYQKVRDLFALSSDYDKTDKATQMFFAETQNKLLYAVTHLTAAEIILARANAELPNFGATSWAGKIVRKGDIFIAKNYLTHDEIDSLNRLVTIFLESAELRVKNRNDLTMGFWRSNVDQLLTFNGFDILSNTGKISNKDMEQIVGERYMVFDARRKKADAEAADREDMAELSEIEAAVISKRGSDKKK